MLKRIISFSSLLILLTLVFAAENTNPLASPIARIGLVIGLLLVCVVGVRNMQKHKKAAQGISVNSSFSSSFSSTSTLQLSSEEQPQYDKYKEYVKTYKGQYSDDQLRKALSDQNVSSIWIDQIFKEV